MLLTAAAALPRCCRPLVRWGSLATVWGLLALPGWAAVEMRVAVQADKTDMIIGSSTTAVIKTVSGESLGQVAGNQGVQAIAENSQIRLGSWSSSAFLLEPTQGGYVFINDTWYRGRILLLAQQGRLTAVNLVELEAYLYSVLGSEMPTSWPQAALQAQAVAARSYALYQRERAQGRPYDVSNTTASQVYRGIAAETTGTHQAVNATRHQVLTYGGQIIEAVFHSSSGGYTENVEDIWQRPVPYLRAVQDYDYDAPVFQWHQLLTQADFQQRVPGVGNLRSAVPERTTPRGRVVSIRLVGDQGSRVISGSDLRKALGLRSTLFTIGLAGDQIQIDGRGYGHGIGLSQWGARTMALQGYTYDQILSHYYQGAALSEVRLP
ncbi:sporulation protein [filamentous cyanobacterium CCP5]|nr:sporulation protein [filamentous cyanobacterium CCP5]